MRVLALLGFSGLTRDGIYTSRADEVWAVNTELQEPDPKIAPRITRLFDMHLPEYYSSNVFHSGSRERKHKDWLFDTKHEYEVVMLEKEPDIHNSITYPFEAVTNMGSFATFGGEEPVEYATSSLAYMLALAIYEDWDMIEIYGYDVGNDTEYYYQRPCIERWLGIAEGRGIKVWLHRKSLLLGKASELYGLSPAQMVSRSQLEKLKGGHQIKFEIISADINKNLGAKKALGGDTIALHEEREELLLKARDQQVILAFIISLIKVLDGKEKLIEHKADDMEG
jgi:hypothetical protein